MIPYARQNIDNDDVKAVIDALKSDYLTQGPRVNEFERKAADYCGARYAVALNSGTSALHAACFAAGLKRGDEAITSAISFAASSNCVLYCGARPRFADILEDTVTMDPVSAKKLMNRKTKVIIPVDFAGHPSELEEIRGIAEKCGVTVIEDAAHALGAEYKKTRIGSCLYSDMTILSFHAVKHITTGEGGMVLTNRKDLYDKLIMFRTHGITRDKDKLFDKDRPRWFYEMQFLGFNYRITDMQCALGLSQMGKLDRFVESRRHLADCYRRALSGVKDAVCLAERPYSRSSWHIFPVRLKKNRDRAFDSLAAAGVSANLHYIPIYLHPYYKKMGYGKGLCPASESYYKEALTLPLYPGMSEEDVKTVVGAIKAVMGNT
ncbi:MAG: UDP-4-amino-4,6-dideoxy-N-acetyl-beta-L-altrosamine transaminase [Candidatus Omnitrophota bacterium]